MVGNLYGQTVWCCACRLASAAVVFHSIGLSSKVGRNGIGTGVAVVAHVLIARPLDLATW